QAALHGACPPQARPPPGGEAGPGPVRHCQLMFRLLLFFPSITFGLLAAEIFPWAIAYWLAARARLATDALLLYGLLALSAAAVVAQGLAPADEAVRSLSAFVNSSIVLLALMKVSEAEARRLAAMLSWVL